MRSRSELSIPSILQHQTEKDEYHSPRGTEHLLQDKAPDTSICNIIKSLLSKKNPHKKYEKKIRKNFRIEPNMIDRRHRVFKNGKLGTSGNPDRYIP